MICSKCNIGTIKEGKYVAKEDGYHVADSDGNVVMLVRPDTIEGDEVDTNTDVEYCSSGEPSTCFCFYWRFK
jgi:hypothetical protein|tara:strand:+ start:118 stop:333 length:216 start_codon:yes stop_codon:yes gene_type:complete